MGVLGITFIFLNAFFISLTVVIVKYLDNVDPSQMIFIRFFGTILFTIPLLIDSGQNPFISASDLNGSNSVKHDGLKSEEQISLTKARILVLARSFFSALGLYLQYWSIKYLPLGDATVIALMVSILVCILARIFLSEPFGLFHLATFILSLIGITLLCKLSFVFGKEKINENENLLLGILFGLASAFLIAVSNVLVRKIKSIPASVLMFHLSLVSMIQSSLILVFFTESGFKFAECGLQPYYFLAHGFLSFFGQFFLIKAIQCEEVGIITLAQTTSKVLFGFIFQISIFHVIPDGWSISGAIVVTLSVLLISARNIVMKMGEESKVRKLLKLITL